MRICLHCSGRKEILCFFIHIFKNFFNYSPILILNYLGKWVTAYTLSDSYYTNFCSVISSIEKYRICIMIHNLLTITIFKTHLWLSQPPQNTYLCFSGKKVCLVHLCCRVMIHNLFVLSTLETHCSHRHCTKTCFVFEVCCLIFRFNFGSVSNFDNTVCKVDFIEQR